MQEEKRRKEMARMVEEQKKIEQEQVSDSLALRMAK